MGEGNNPLSPIGKVGITMQMFENRNGLTLRQLSDEFAHTEKVNVSDNGKSIFRGVVGAINKSFKPMTLSRKCSLQMSYNVDGNGNCSDVQINVYLERKVK